MKLVFRFQQFKKKIKMNVNYTELLRFFITHIHSLIGHVKEIKCKYYSYEF